MDIILHNGRVNTLDGAGTVYSAVGAANGMIAALGTDEELRRLMGPKTEAAECRYENRRQLGLSGSQPRSTGGASRCCAAALSLRRDNWAAGKVKHGGSHPTLYPRVGLPFF